MDAAPYFDDVANGPDGAHALWLRTADARRLRLGVFPRAGAQGTVLIFPGRTEYIEKYAPAAAEFSQRGLAALAIDWRGQGLSDRTLPGQPLIGHVRRFTNYQFDVAAMVEAAFALRLPRPWYLLAHSMGGAIALRALVEGLTVSAVVFSAPMWDIVMPPATRAKAVLISGASRIVGQANRPVPGSVRESYLTATQFEDNALTTDRAMWDWMRGQVTTHPGLALGGPSLLWLSEAMLDCRRMARIASPRVPSLTVVGSDETIVDPAAIQTRMARWPGGRLSVYDGARHEILMEAPRQRARFHDEADALFALHRS